MLFNLCRHLTTPSAASYILKRTGNIEAARILLGLAKRIALVDPTMLATNKLAVNRVYESMGLRQATDAANSLDVMAHQAEIMHQFLKTSRADGLKAALAENDAPFRDTPRPFKVPGG